MAMEKNSENAYGFICYLEHTGQRLTLPQPQVYREYFGFLRLLNSNEV